MKVWMKVSSPMLGAMFLLVVFFSGFGVVEMVVEGDILLILEWELLSYNGISFCFPVFFDKISIIFSGVVLLISFSVMLFSSSYMSGDKNLEYFIFMVLMFVLSMNLLVFSPHLISLLLGWDGLGLSSYLLVIYYLNDKSLSAGMLTALTNRIGDSLLILGSSWAFIGGQWNFYFSSYGVMGFFAVCVVVAAMTKSAQIPFSAWLPAAMAAPTPVSALVHSSTLVTAGVYLLIRFFPSLELFSFFSGMCFFVGVFTCFMAGLAAVMETDLKKIIALSTLSQLGVMMIALGLNQPMVSFFHLIIHALFKALLFICAGNIIHSMGNSQDIRLMGNISSVMPLTCSVLNFANMSLCGLPFMAGFYSKDMIVENFFTSNQSVFLGVVLLMSVCMTSLYTVKLSVVTLWSPFYGGSLLKVNNSSKNSVLAYIILLLGAVLGGSFFSWLVNPSLELINVPKTMKILVLGLILLFGGCMYVGLNNNTGFNFHFFSSMWFLSFLSSYFTVQVSSGLSKVILYNEQTFMEKMSGGGMNEMVNKEVEVLQKLSNMNFSTMMTSISVFVFLVVIFN